MHTVEQALLVQGIEKSKFLISKRRMFSFWLINILYWWFKIYVIKRPFLVHRILEEQVSWEKNPE